MAMLLAVNATAFGSDAGKPESKTFATVGGAAITETEVVQQIQGELQKLEDHAACLLVTVDSSNSPSFVDAL